MISGTPWTIGRCGRTADGELAIRDAKGAIVAYVPIGQTAVAPYLLVNAPRLLTALENLMNASDGCASDALIEARTVAALARGEC